MHQECTVHFFLLYESLLYSPQSDRARYSGVLLFWLVLSFRCPPSTRFVLLRRCSKSQSDLACDDDVSTERMITSCQAKESPASQNGHLDAGGGDDLPSHHHHVVGHLSRFVAEREKSVHHAGE